MTTALTAFGSCNVFGRCSARSPDRRFSAVLTDPTAHLLHAGDPIGLPEEVPRLRDQQRDEPAVEAAADDTIVRAVGLEEERFARGQDPESEHGRRV
jgi:hypothetical protein